MKFTYFLSFFIMCAGYTSAYGIDFSLGELMKGMPLSPAIFEEKNLQHAVTNSNPYPFKCILSSGDTLTRETKEELLSVAKEIAQESRRKVRLFRSMRDASSFLLGSALSYYFKNGNVFGNAEKLIEMVNIMESYKQDDGSYAYHTEAEENHFNSAMFEATKLARFKSIDTLIFYSSVYLAFRGYFTFSAHTQNKKAHQVVEYLERITTTE